MKNHSGNPQRLTKELESNNDGDALFPSASS